MSPPDHGEPAKPRPHRQPIEQRWIGWLELQLALDIAHTVLGEASSTPSSTASMTLMGTTATDMKPARLSSRSGYHVVNATRLMLIGQPATVSAIRYISSGRLARSHSRTTARKAWPQSQ